MVRGSDKGYVHSMDYVGPYSPDVDGDIYGLVGVETKPAAKSEARRGHFKINHSFG